MAGPIAVVFVCTAIAIGFISFVSLKKAKDLVSQQRRYFIVGVLTFLLTFLANFLFWSYRFVPADKLGISKLSWGSGTLGPSEILANNGESGWQASVYAPGYHFLPWPWFEFEVYDMTEVPQGFIGVVEALDGALPVGSKNGTQVVTSDYIWKPEEIWIDPKVFLQTGKGFRGLQNPPLQPGNYRLHPKLFRVIPVDTTVQSLRFGTGESVEPGIDAPIETTLNGAPVVVHVWVRFQVTQESAYKALQQLGTIDIDNRVKRTVQSQVRISVRDRLKPITVSEFDANSQDACDSIKTAMEEKLNPYGINIVSVGFTSVYDKESDGLLTQIRKQQGDMQLSEQSALAEKAKIMLVDAKAKTMESQDAVEASHVKRKLEALRVALDDRNLSPLEEAVLFSELMGSEEAMRYLTVKEIAKAGIEIVPRVVTGDESVSLDISAQIERVLPLTSPKSDRK